MDRLIGLVRVALLERRAAKHGKPHQPRDHVHVVRGLATAVARLRLLELRDQRTDRRHARERTQAPLQPGERGDVEPRIGREVPERHDRADVRPGVRVPEREVPGPRAVGGDAVADAEREDERRDRGRREDRLRHELRRRVPRRVCELEVVRCGALGLRHVGREDDELLVRMRELLGDGRQVADPPVDRLGQRVLVQADQRQTPEPVRPENVVGAELEQELLEVVDAVERGHHAGERAGRRPEDPANSRPERALAHALQEARFHQHSVDRAA